MASPTADLIRAIGEAFKNFFESFGVFEFIIVFVALVAVILWIDPELVRGIGQAVADIVSPILRDGA